SLAALSIAAGCGRAALEDAETTTPAFEPPTHAKRDAADAKIDPTEGLDDAVAVFENSVRKPGDFVVYRFSGAYRTKPITLTERVVAKKGDTILVDVVADDGGKKQELLVKMSEGANARAEILGVQKVENGQAKPADLAAYDALMAKTTLAADQNQSVLATEDL